MLGVKTIQNQNGGAAKTECRHTPTVLCTRIYRARWTPTLDAALTKCRHLQRALYNQTIASVPSQGGRVPASQKTRRCLAQLLVVLRFRFLLMDPGCVPHGVLRGRSSVGFAGSGRRPRLRAQSRALRPGVCLPPALCSPWGLSLCDLAPATALGTPVSAGSVNLGIAVGKPNATLALIGLSLRNVLSGLAALTVVICGGAAFMGRFPATWLWTVGGGVLCIALGGLAVDVLVKDTAVPGNTAIYAIELQ